MLERLNTKSDVDLDADEENDEEVQAALGETSTEVAALASAISTSLTSSESIPGMTPGLNPGIIPVTVEAKATVIEPTYVERIVERIIERPMRRRLPDTRHSLTHHFNVAGHEGYLTVGMYDDHTPGELFITMSKEGSTIGGLMDSLGTAISVALQYGVPVESLVTKFAHQRFEPMGMTTNRDIPFAKSLVDYIFRWMGMEFIPGYREANAPQRPASSTPKAQAEPAKTLKEEKSWSGPDVNNRVGGMANAASENRVGSSGGDSEKIEGISASARIREIGVGDEASRGQVVVESRTHIERDVRVVAESASSAASAVMAVDALSQATAQMMGDAPACGTCGSITVRNGTCYKCLNCGNSMGCS